MHHKIKRADIFAFDQNIPIHRNLFRKATGCQNTNNALFQEKKKKGKVALCMDASPTN